MKLPLQKVPLSSCPLQWFWVCHCPFKHPNIINLQLGTTRQWLPFPQKCAFMDSQVDNKDLQHIILIISKKPNRKFFLVILLSGNSNNPSQSLQFNMSRKGISLHSLCLKTIHRKEAFKGDNIKVLSDMFFLQRWFNCGAFQFPNSFPPPI